MLPGEPLRFVPPCQTHQDHWHQLIRTACPPTCPLRPLERMRCGAVDGVRHGAMDGMGRGAMDDVRRVSRSVARPPPPPPRGIHNHHVFLSPLG
jgi:hypothetical protein